MKKEMKKETVTITITTRRNIDKYKTKLRL